MPAEPLRFRPSSTPKNTFTNSSYGDRLFFCEQRLLRQTAYALVILHQQNRSPAGWVARPELAMVPQLFMKVRLRSLPSFVLCFAVITQASLNDAGAADEKFVVVRAEPHTLEQLKFVRELHDNMHKYDVSTVAFGFSMMLAGCMRTSSRQISCGSSRNRRPTVRSLPGQRRAVKAQNPAFAAAFVVEKGLEVERKSNTAEIKDREMGKMVVTSLNRQLDFWLTPVALGHKADIMIRQERQKWLENLFSNYSIPHNITIKDVQQLILEREHQPKNSSSKYSKRLNDEGGNKARYGLGEYHSYEHIIHWMEDIQRYYPDKARVVNIGTTEEGRPIKGIKIGSNVHRNDKRIVWIDGGIHAREWAAVHTVIYVIDRVFRQ
ncbi:carboxypeptidase activation peptide [Ancylostoma ceylanicum]|uniref:Carboxypeptidase activation peptide n=1 Tax=Ancylostoma ceylanicum TaxID=53326 RepID=A0A0D6M3E7_9BILA|nr:carboxypeptidase activation peptide [Ancylostoma ceylanicum]